MSEKSIKALFEESFNRLSEDDKLDNEALALAGQFLSSIDAAMAEQKMSKKDLAKEVGTSASYITQLFMGDRKPNWVMIVKMAKALNLNFNILTDLELKAKLSNSVLHYHRNWAKSITYQTSKDLEIDESVVMAVVESDYALAG